MKLTVWNKMKIINTDIKTGLIKALYRYKIKTKRAKLKAINVASDPKSIIANKPKPTSSKLFLLK